MKTACSLVSAAITAWAALAVPEPARACGPDSDCRVGEQTYRLRLPAGHDGKTPVGAIMFMHGYRGSAAGVMRNGRLGEAVSDLGLALIAPKSSGHDWSIPGAPQEDGDELVLFDRLLEDIAARFPIDMKRIMATGFSAGGMMTWNLACERGDRFAGFAPIAGTFWAPLPESCSSPPVHLLHTHGTSDPVVPLEGRPIQKTRQGNVYEALALFAAAGNFGPPRSTEILDLQCERRLNPEGHALELCLHPGGHSFKTDYVIRAWQALVELGAVD